MSGFYTMRIADGGEFAVAIPRFSLLYRGTSINAARFFADDFIGAGGRVIIAGMLFTPIKRAENPTNPKNAKNPKNPKND